MDNANGLVLVQELSLEEMLERLMSPVEPEVYNETLYFCPVPRKRLQDLLAEGDIEKHRASLKIIKREQIMQIYQSVASFAMALINIDALRSMQTSLEYIKKAKDQLPEVSERLMEIGQETLTMINRLAQIPIDTEASQRISDLAKEYNSLVQEHMPELQNLTGLAPKDSLVLYVQYGANYQGRQLETFEDLMQYVGFSGYGYPDIDSLRFGLRTSSNLLFKITYSPNSFSEGRQLYGLSEETTLLSELLPIQVTVTSEQTPTIHADLLRKKAKTIKDRFDREDTTPFERTTLLYCPPLSLGEEKPHSRLTA